MHSKARAKCILYLLSWVYLSPIDFPDTLFELCQFLVVSILFVMELLSYFCYNSLVTRMHHLDASNESLKFIRKQEMCKCPQKEVWEVGYRGCEERQRQAKEALEEVIRLHGATSAYQGKYEDVEVVNQGRRLEQVVQLFLDFQRYYAQWQSIAMCQSQYQCNSCSFQLFVICYHLLFMVFR